MSAKKRGGDIVLRVQHSRQTISTLSRVQYIAARETRLIVQVIVAVVCILLGARLIGSIAEPFNYLFLMYGCFSIIFLYLPARARSDKLIGQIESAGGRYPCTVFTFGPERIHILAEGDAGPGEDLAYDRCARLLEHRGDLYFFISRDAAFIFPAGSIPRGETDAVKAMLEARTGLRFTALNRWYSVSLPSLLRARQNTRRR